MTKLQQIVERVIRQHRGLRAAARATGLDPGYLCRLRDGERDDPGDGILAKLGYERRVIYRPLERGKIL